jgi:hypothetical protein
VCLGANARPSLESNDDRDRRQFGLPEEDDMVIAESEEQAATSGKQPYMRNRLREKKEEWDRLGACPMVMGWVTRGYDLWFETPCPPMRSVNQESCFEPKAQFDFVDESIKQLLDRGVVGRWDPAWGSPMVISPLKVVDKKGGLFRLILDLSKLNRHLRFPRFKYDSVKAVGRVFDQGDWLFSWDLKDGYWHTDLNESAWTYMCFEWEGQLYHFAVMPFGLAPACWVFTKLVRVAIKHLRTQGLKCLSYIDDGLGGASDYPEAARLRDMTVSTLTNLGWRINFDKSELDLAHLKEFLGYLIDTVGGGTGTLSPSPSRRLKLKSAVSRALKSRKISPREVARVVGYIVSLRPCLDPMAMLFTKHLNIWTQRSLDRYPGNWDWMSPLSGEAREELRI